MGGDEETEGERWVYRVRRQRVYRVGCDEETEDKEILLQKNALVT